MSEVLADWPVAPPPEPAPRPEGGGPHTWRVTPHGVRTVARLELRQRVRATRWHVVLGLWTLAIWGLSFLVWLAAGPASGGDASSLDDTGRLVFAVVVLMVLTLGSLVAPALSATSINGDRQAGVLATLQTTLLSPAEITLGKLLASWLTALALLATASPAIVAAYFLGGTPFARVLVTLVVLALTLLVVCAIGLACSAVAAKASSSAVLTYVSVAFLGLGLPLLFALTLPFTSQLETVQVRQPDPSATDPDSFRCVTSTERLERQHTERTWWIIAPSPYVVVADAAPRPGPDEDQDILTGIRDGVRQLRLGAPDTLDWCGEGLFVSGEREDEAAQLGPVWPFGLAADLLVAAGATWLTVRRLRAPSRKLPRGTRVA